MFSIRASHTALFALVAGMLCRHVHAADTPNTGSIARGHTFVVEHCSLCHAVERTGTSSYRPTPPFRTLHERYDVEGLAEAFAEGIVVPHQGPRQMPQFMLSPAEIDDLIAYLKSLERTPSRKTRASR
jgi:mono/diheme cytochrome c family protein